MNTTQQRPWGYLPQSHFLKDLFVRQVGHPHPYGRVRAQNVMSLIRPGLNTLDVGCGEGVFSRELGLRGYNVTGVDLDPEAILAAQKNAETLGVDIQFVVGDATQLPFADSSFDQAISTDVIEHVPDPLVALRDIRRVLKPGGTFVVTVPTPKYLAQPFFNHDFSQHLKNIGHIHHGWFYEDFAKMLEASGFRIDRYAYYGHWPIQLLMEIAFIKMGAQNISSERRGLYNLKWSTLIQFALLLPVIWADRLFSKKKKSALIAVRATAI
jgi:ubiquinone/menaquinone biosynthesis C-methylase UbiE